MLVPTVFYNVYAHIKVYLLISIVVDREIAVSIKIPAEKPLKNQIAIIICIVTIYILHCILYN